MTKPGRDEVVFCASPFEYGLILVCAGLVSAFLMPVRPLAPSVWGIGSLILGMVSVYAVLGFLRPRKVTLDTDAMVIRPVLGRARRYLRSDIAGVEEIVTPPLGSLIAHVRQGDSRTRGVTLQHRLYYAGLGVREHGREAGIPTSVRATAFRAWLDRPR